MDLILSAATHRSGSTLVQRILNARAGTLIWGEHGGVVREFLWLEHLVAHFSKHSQEERELYFGSGENPNVWTASMTPDLPYLHEALVRAVRTFFAALYEEGRDQHDRVGFKEVRYGRRELELLREAFPHAALVLLVRNPIYVWKSTAMHWEDIEEFCRIWNQHALEYQAMASDPNQTGVYLFRYEDIVDREPNTIQRLISLAGITEENLLEVLGVKLNSTTRGILEEEAEAIRDVCREGMEAYGYR